MTDSVHTPTGRITDLLDELRWRGLVKDCTDEAALRAHLADPLSRPRRVYCGFDPTADSLTIGNLVAITMLRWVQRAGHIPVVVMGGGTGLIGDPSGKSAERQLMTPDRVAANVRAQQPIFEALLDFTGDPERRPSIVNNLDWLGSLSYIQALRDIGKHFSVNVMIQRDSVRERLNNRDQGISYTEFSYMILQAYDFLHLYESHGVTVQLGGSDQWGNIVAGTDLIRRVHHDAPSFPHGNSPYETFGLTAPLVTKADGGKFGKTESGAVWLTPERTSPYAFHQFWLNAADDDALRWLRLFTLLPRADIQATTDRHAAEPHKRHAQRALADHMTDALHGPEARASATRAAEALFAGRLADLAPDQLRQTLHDAPQASIDGSRLQGQGVALIDLLVEAGLAASKREAKDFLQAGSVSVNGAKAGIDQRITSADLLHGELVAVRRGKKQWTVVRPG